jgi:tRNA (guanine10-N2)-methyltransferase
MVPAEYNSHHIIMKEYLIFLAQSHPAFRKAELESLADLHNIKADFSNHNEEHPFMIVQLENDEEAYQLIDRAILSKSIYELWGHGSIMEELHTDVKKKVDQLKERYIDSSFKFENLTFQGGKKSREQQVAIFDQFRYLEFTGKIKLKNPDQVYTILEQYSLGANLQPLDTPDHIWFGRQVNISARSRGAVEKYDIKKRPYFGTTSFDAELSLFTCNMGQVKKSDLIYDPFVGTGSFLVTAAEFGGITIGSDIDFLTLKGKGPKRRLKSNFDYYKKPLQFTDVLCMDFTNNAFRSNLKFGSILCDPPYGVREGVKVCGSNDPRKEGREKVVIDGQLAFLRRDYIPPKKAYSLDLLLDDLLHFASERLDVGSRLCFWMPVANDEDIPTMIPQHEDFELIYELVQDFHKWSRRLLVYLKRDDDYKGITLTTEDREGVNNFRDRYFHKFSKLSMADKKNSNSSSGSV